MHIKCKIYSGLIAYVTFVTVIYYKCQILSPVPLTLALSQHSYYPITTFQSLYVTDERFVWLNLPVWFNQLANKTQKIVILCLQWVLMSHADPEKVLKNIHFIQHLYSYLYPYGKTWVEKKLTNWLTFLHECSRVLRSLIVKLKFRQNVNFSNNSLQDKVNKIVPFVDVNNLRTITETRLLHKQRQCCITAFI